MKSENYFAAGVFVIFLLLSSEVVNCGWFSLWGNQQASVSGIPQAESISTVYKNCLDFASRLSPQEVRVEKSKDCEQIIQSYLEVLKAQEPKSSLWPFNSSQAN